MTEYRIVTLDPCYGPGSLQAGTAGIYGLADPRDMRVRYIGSSDCIERRLYAHAHLSGGKHLPRGRWLKTLAVDGVAPLALVLEEGVFGPPQSAERHAAERRWIDAYVLVGEADLNVRLTPLGHAHSKDTPGKRLHAEVVSLRKRVAELELEIIRLQKTACNTQRGATRCATVHGNTATPATHPFRGVAVLHSAVR